MPTPIVFDQTVYGEGFIGVGPTNGGNTASSSVTLAGYLAGSYTLNGSVSKAGDTVSLINDYTHMSINITATSFDNSGTIEFMYPNYADLIVSNQKLSIGQTITYAESTLGDYSPDPVCLVSGTLIETARGAVAVEALRVGDEVVTAGRAKRRIRWLGHRTLACKTMTEPSRAWPVRISAHAFGEGRPARDLYVSPGHAVCVDAIGEILVPAMSLVNGATIVQVEVDTVTYWHVELDSHDILLAENLAVESYLDMGNRRFFKEADVVDLAAGPDPTSPILTGSCRPFHADGPLVSAARARLEALARPEGARRRRTSRAA